PPFRGLILKPPSKKADFYCPCYTQTTKTIRNPCIINVKQQITYFLSKYTTYHGKYQLSVDTLSCAVNIGALQD
ncbi:hypothetical protein ACV1OS_003248, partial [Vibrio cholerae]